MRECHVSPNTITEVREKYGYKQDDGLKVELASQKSLETQALKLFSEGKKPLEVAIELDIATDYVFMIYQNFQRLRNLEGFVSAYEYVKGNIQPFLHLSDLMFRTGMSPEQVAEQVRYGNNLPHLRRNHSTFTSEIRALESKTQYLNLQLNLVHNQLENYIRSLRFYENQCQSMANHLLFLNSEIDTKKSFLQNLDNEGAYVRLREDAKKVTKTIMQNNYVLSAVTLSATLEAIRRYPDNQMLMFDIVSSQGYSALPYQQPWMESHTPQLLQLIGNVHNEMVEQVTSMVVSTKLIQYKSQGGRASASVHDRKIIEVNS